MTIKMVQDGKIKSWTNDTSADVVSGQLVKQANTLVIAAQDIADGAVGQVYVEGVFSGVPKVSAAVFVFGEKLVWDISANTNAGAFDDSAASPATGDVTGAAIAWVAGANGETTCTIKLTPGNATLT